MILEKFDLENPSPDRAVTGVCVAGNREKHGGVIVKFTLQDSSRTETLTFLRASGAALGDAIDQAGQKGHLPRLNKDERAALVASMPKIEDYDWNLQGQKSRIVHAMQVLMISKGFSFEFVMKDGTRRPFLVSPKITQFMGEYLYAYRDCLYG